MPRVLVRIEVGARERARLDTRWARRSGWAELGWVRERRGRTWSLQVCRSFVESVVDGDRSALMVQGKFDAV